MTDIALFLNGVYERVLDGILCAQKNAANDTFYLQPYKSVAMARFRQDPPTILYASTTTDLAQVSHRADIVGWMDKRRMDKSSAEWKRIDESIRAWGYDPGLYDFDPLQTERKMVNLVFIQELVKLDPPFSVSRLIKISDGDPLSTNRTRSGGWSYVVKT